MTISVDLIDATHKLSQPSISWIAQHIDKAMQHLGCTGEVRVRVVEDAEMAQAHEEFAGVPGPTDVLTFDLTDRDELGNPPDMNVDLGRLVYTQVPYGIDTDILVCLDEANRQSQLNPSAKGGVGTPRGPEKELLLYVVHGILHCLGMDDHEEQAFEAMHNVEDRILAAIGVGPVFKASPPDAASGA